MRKALNSLKSTYEIKSKTLGGTEGARRATGVPPKGVGAEMMNISPPDPEVPAKKARRWFTTSYKLKILQEADNCTKIGQIGALLRREGLYSSHLSSWRRQRGKGILSAMAPKKRGRKAVDKNPLVDKVTKLEKENQKLRKRLWQAERIIEVQKKISEILGIDQNTKYDGPNNS